MTVVHKIVVRLIGVVLVIALAGCGPALATETKTETETATVSQSLSTLAETSLSETWATEQSNTMVWGKVPYCSCQVGIATANVTVALKEANLAVTVKELSPSDGWLYFAATFDPASATLAQVTTAIMAGGGHLLDGPP